MVDYLSKAYAIIITDKDKGALNLDIASDYEKAWVRAEIKPQL